MESSSDLRRSAARRALALLLLALALTACNRWNWREERSAEDGWTATFPDKSQVTEREVTALGRSLPMRMQASGVGPTLFAVGVMRLPPEIATDAALRAALLAWTEEGLVRRFGLRDLQRTKPALVVPPGRQLQSAAAFTARASVGAERRAGTIAARLFIVDDRLYQVLALGAEGELPPEVEDTFLASFRLLPR